MRLLAIATLALAGCAFTPEHMAQQSNYDVCRFTMGGPHSRVAEQEAQRRSLDCRPMYSVIQQREAANNAAIRAVQPAPVQRRPSANCTSYQVGNTVQTDCR